jgi:hypothetical protein
MAKKVNETVDLKGKEEVVFVSNGKSKHMPKGSEYTVGADTAKIFLENKYGEVK